MNFKNTILIITLVLFLLKTVFMFNIPWFIVLLPIFLCFTLIGLTIFVFSVALVCYVICESQIKNISPREVIHNVQKDLGNIIKNYEETNK